MVFRTILLTATGFALAACQPQVPDSARGVGFESYSTYMQRRDGQLAGGGTAGAPLSAASGTIATQPIGTTSLDADPARPRDAVLMQGINQNQMPGPSGIPPLAPAVQPVPGQPAQGQLIGGGNSISDEQNFDAVASRESIQSDAERIRRQREQYVVVDPTALPQRSAAEGPNVVQYALSTSHSPGTKMHSRSSIRFKSYESACAPFTSADLAQEEFLRRGGPNRDPLGVDPDGDGFACGWDPRPFRG